MLQTTSTPIKEPYDESNFEEGDLSFSEISSAFLNESSEHGPFEPSLNDSQQYICIEIDEEISEEQENGKCCKRKFSER